MRNIIVALLLIGLNSCHGQDKGAAQKPSANISGDTTSETMIGLVSNRTQIDDYVVEVFEDSKGNLWLGT